MNFDRVASTYDLLSTLVFGASIKNSKIHFPAMIPAGANVLIIGGGTGLELETLGSGLKSVTFLDPSRAMIKKASSRDIRLPINFEVVRFEDFESEIKYDYVICNYYLDIYSDGELASILKQIRLYMHNRSRLIVTDFRLAKCLPYSLLFKLLKYIMYMYFGIFTGLRNRRLPKIEEALLNDWIKEQEEVFYQGFIWTARYSTLSAKARNSE